MIIIQKFDYYHVQYFLFIQIVTAIALSHFLITIIFGNLQSVNAVLFIVLSLIFFMINYIISTKIIGEPYG